MLDRVPPRIIDASWVATTWSDRALHSADSSCRPTLGPADFSQPRTRLGASERVPAHFLVDRLALAQQRGTALDCQHEGRTLDARSHMRASRPAADDRNRSSKLGNSLNADLARIAAEDLSPWVKLGHVIFRAEEITYTRQRAEVRAAVRDWQVMGATRAHDTTGLPCIRIADDAVRPRSELLLTEHLVGGKLAEDIVHFRLGP